jgi:hypothetical protein
VWGLRDRSRRASRASLLVPAEPRAVRLAGDSVAAACPCDVAGHFLGVAEDRQPSSRPPIQLLFAHRSSSPFLLFGEGTQCVHHLRQSQTVVRLKNTASRSFLVSARLAMSCLWLAHGRERRVRASWTGSRRHGEKLLGTSRLPRHDPETTTSRFFGQTAYHGLISHGEWNRGGAEEALTMSRIGGRVPLRVS